MTDNTLSYLSKLWKPRVAESAPFSGPSHYQIGLETITNSDRYFWDGMKRGGDSRHPYVVFQVTLAGFGIFSKQSVETQVPAGHAFLAYVPSPHKYFFPEGSGPWTFYWLLLRHPYLAERIKRLLHKRTPVLPIEARSGLTMQSIELFSRACLGDFASPIQQEQALFNWYFALDSHLNDLSHPADIRVQYLREARTHTLAKLPEPPDVSRLAAIHGLSRTNYSHLFRSATGMTPARYILQVRLEEAARLLTQHAMSIKEVAHATGFANANHFSKCFRKHYAATPAQYLSHAVNRRQLPG